jgi:hypothetical protein
MKHRTIQDPKVSIRILDENARSTSGGSKNRLVGNNVRITSRPVPKIRDRAKIRVVAYDYSRIIRLKWL